MNFFVLLLSLQTHAASLDADVTMNPVGDFHAKTNDVLGEATLAGETVKAEKIVVKLDKILTGKPIRDRHAREKYLEVEKFPEAILTNAEGKDGKGTGTLKFHGEEKKVSGTYKIDGSTLKAAFPIKLSDFNIKGVSYMGVGVEDDVKINIEVPIRRR